MSAALLLAKRRIWRPTVVRRDPLGTWWIMNRRETGFASFGYFYPSLDAVLEAWDVRVTGEGADKHGPFVEVSP